MSTADELRAQGVLVVDEVTVRRIVKTQLGLETAGLRVPHHHCFVAKKAILEKLHAVRENAAGMGETIVVVAADRAAVASGSADALRGLWRLVFHARVHEALDALDGLTVEACRERIEAIGQAEMDEVRAVLDQERLLLPPGDERAIYAELVALWSELRQFAPHAVEHTFPAVTDPSRIDRLITRDIDVAAILAASRPPNAPDLAVEAAPEPSASMSLSTRTRVDAESRSARSGASKARERGNLARAAILSCRAEDPASARIHLESLVERLGNALGLEASATRGWVDALLPLAEYAGAQDSLRFNTGTRLLADLQAACTVGEREVKVADFVTWLLSFGRRPLVRALPVTREVRMAKRIHKAASRVPACELAEASDRDTLAEVMRAIAARADENVRTSLRPKIDAALAEVGLEPHSLPERVAQKKLVDELLDRAVDVGRLSMGDLRDAISKNDLKMPDLTLGGLREGDQLLRVDRILERSLDGVYRSGELYLRALQKASSVLFGTFVGRLLTKFVLLPLLGAFAVVEGLQHMVGPLVKLFTGHMPQIATSATLYGGAAFLFLLIHVPVFRRGVTWVLVRVWRAVKRLLFDWPLALWRTPFVRRIRDSRIVRWLIRPAIPALIVVLVVEHKHRWWIAAGTLVVAASIANSRFGRLVEERTTDWAIQSSRQFMTRFIPGLVRYTLEFFGTLADLVDRGMYRIDELLRFRSGQSVIKVFIKGVLSALWFVVAYVLRLYVDLFIEPTTNPIKHFPVVTVAAKIIIPIIPSILSAVAGPTTKIFGPAIGNGFAAFTVLVLPGLAGFLVWELKENWKLYKATRAKTLGPLVIGQHGETMLGFLRPGFHSGTIPKHFMKLRRAAWRDDVAGIAKQHDGLHHVDVALERFVDRQLVSMLTEIESFRIKDVAVAGIEIGSNRVTITLACESLAAGPAVLRFEHQSGWIVAGIASPGWFAKLDAGQQRILEIALAGFYKLAAVSLVRQQIESAFRERDGTTPPYDISDVGLVVWPDARFDTELVYDLRATKLFPTVRNGSYDGVLTEVDLSGRHAIFAREPLYWSVWATTWQQIQRGEEPMRVIVGPSLLS